MKANILIAVAAIGLMFGSCTTEKKTNEIPKTLDTNYVGVRFESSGTLSLPVTHVFNTAITNGALVLDRYYQTPLGDSIKCTELSYYLTNVSLLNSNNAWVNLGNYDLISESDVASKQIMLTNIPAGTYSKLRFLIGVDSLANSSGLHDGELSPGFGMYWTWATGYIFFRFKGRASANRSVTFDIGGDVNLPVVELPLTSFKKSGTAITLNTEFNLADIFVSPHNYSLDSNSIDIHTTTNPDVYKLRDNISSGAFSIKSVQ